MGLLETARNLEPINEAIYRDIIRIQHWAVWILDSCSRLSWSGCCSCLVLGEGFDRGAVAEAGV